MIPLGREDTKPFNKGNPFLDDSKRRGDIEVDGPVGGVIPLGGRKPAGNNPFIGSPGFTRPPHDRYPAGSPGSGIPDGTGDYGDVKYDSHPGVTPQGGNIDGSYSPGGNPQGPGPVQCKLGIFGCGTPGSGSYTAVKGGKHPGGTFGGNVGIGSGGPGSVDSGPGRAGSPGVGVGAVSGNYGASASHPGTAGGNLAGSVGGSHAGAYAGSFSGARASSSSFAGAKSLSFSNAGGSYLAQECFDSR